MGIIEFDGRDSSTYNLVVEHFPDYTMPKPDYEVVHVPGKNGDIIIDKGSFQNIERKYDIAIANDPAEDDPEEGIYASTFHKLITRIGEWLYPTSGYAKLTDSYDTDHFYMASYQQGLSIKNIENYGARATVSFNCKPFRYLNIGETVKTFTTDDTDEHNTVTWDDLETRVTVFESNPLLTIYKISGDTSLTINDITISISNIPMPIIDRDKPLIIDTEIQEAYIESSSSGIINCNHFITALQGFPQLKYGFNYFTFSSPITKLEVIPRWFTI